MALMCSPDILYSAIGEQFLPLVALSTPHSTEEGELEQLHTEFLVLIEVTVPMNVRVHVRELRMR